MTFLVLAWLIRSLRGSTLVGIDVHKLHRPRIPEMGGLAVLLGFYAGLIYVVLFTADTIVISPTLYHAALLAIFGTAFVGVFDDLFAVRKWLKAIFPFVFSVPLAFAIYLIGDTNLLGLDVGILILIFVPVGVASAANVANMLEGLNGLGAGLGILLSGGLIVLAIVIGAFGGLFLLVPLLGALLAFLWFNRFPARVFPGDSMTLTVGATVACAAIISSPPLKMYAAFMFAPMIIEFLLKARGRFRAENYGEIGPDGRLQRQGRVESLTHLVMKWKRLREWEVVAIIWLIEAAVCAAVILAVAASL